MQDYKKLLIDIESPVSEALTKLDVEGTEVVFIVDGDVLKGSLTNGDIRRALASGSTNRASISDFMNPNPQFILENASPVDTYRAFSKGVTCIPILKTNRVVVDVLFKSESRTIPIAEPNLSSREIELVNETLASNWISSSGIYVQEFEDAFSKYINSKYVLSVCNGTQAIALALAALEIKPGDEVIVPALTFGATANAVIQVGAVPVFADIDGSTLGLSLETIEAKVTSKTKAILLVHLYGRPSDLDEILNYSKSRGILVVEDCAEAIGTTYKNIHVGTQSDAGTFSFFANKTITTGEGGMVCFRDRHAFEKAKLIRSHGFDPKNRYWHLTWGTNMRLTNMQAAIGVGQMERIHELVGAKKKIAEVYDELVAANIPTHFRNRDITHLIGNSYWLYILEFAETVDIDALILYLSERRIETRRVFTPLNLQPAFEHYIPPGAIFPISQQKFDYGICLPSSTKLKLVDQVEVIEGIKNYLSMTAQTNTVKVGRKEE